VRIDATRRDTVTPAAKLRTREREHQIVQLRTRGAHWRDIAEATGVSMRGAMLAWDRALRLIVLPGVEQAKKELVEKCRALELNLWTAFHQATGDPTQMATVANSILRCQQRMSALLGCDTPSQVALQMAMAPPMQDEATVRNLRQNLSTDELRQLVMLSAKASGRPAPLAITATAPAPAMLPSSQPNRAAS
jgi:hypothetical protein